MKNEKQNIIIVVLTIFTVLVWLTSNLYHISVTSTVPTNVMEAVTPFDPKIDLLIFDKLRAKKNLNEFNVTEIVPTEATSSQMGE